MKRLYLILLAAFVAGAISCSRNISKAEKLWSSPAGLEVPESVLYNSGENVLYVSNINGKPTEKNGRGFISKLSTDGKIVALQWITGLNAPKGMGLNATTLYVTDIDRIYEIDIVAGKKIKTYTVAGAKFLNDIAIDSQGTVYITDMTTNKLHAIQGGTVSDWIDLNPYTSANGLFMDKGMLLVGTAEGVLKINPQTKKVELYIPNKGGIDGLKSLDHGRYIISDWAGKTQIIQQGKPAIVLLNTTSDKINAADFEYIKDKQMLLIPTFFHNSVDAYRLK
ncbi:MAG: hypothetical protein A2176_12875 [Spirochaetes bacterium RBG_13_51_14]|nr:MAG: hypothetical protein A2176_12875 [Spirochaetes bacterium RBG_13_51_14]